MKARERAPLHSRKHSEGEEEQATTCLIGALLSFQLFLRPADDPAPFPLHSIVVLHYIKLPNLSADALTLETTPLKPDRTLEWSPSVKKLPLTVERRPREEVLSWKPSSPCNRGREVVPLQQTVGCDFIELFVRSRESGSAPTRWLRRNAHGATRKAYTWETNEWRSFQE